MTPSEPTGAVFLVIKAQSWPEARQEAQKRGIAIIFVDYLVKDWDQIAAETCESNLLKVQQWYNEPGELGDDGYPFGTLLFFNRKPPDQLEPNTYTITTPFGVANLRHDIELPIILQALGILYRDSAVSEISQTAANTYYRIKGQFVTNIGFYRRNFSK